MQSAIRAPLALAIMSALCSSSVFAQDFTIKASVNAKLLNQNTQSAQGTFQTDTYTTTPSISSSYESGKLRASFTGKITQVTRSSSREGVDNSKNFGSYSYQSTLDIIDDVLSVSGSGSFSYQNTDASNYFTNDNLSLNNSQVKSRTNTVDIQFRKKTGKYITSSGTIRYSVVETGKTAFRSSFQNDTYALNGTVKNGSASDRLTWQIETDYRTTRRDSLDFITRLLRGQSEYAMSQHVSLLVTAMSDGYQYQNLDGASSTTLLESAGVGFTFRNRRDQSLSVTYNNSKSNNDTNDRNSFISFDLRWPFSSRSSIAASYSRRAQGFAGSLNAKYNTKKIRAALSYRDVVTNYARLIATDTNASIFVCPIGDAVLSDCFQPAGLNYSLGPDEQFIQFFSPVYEASELVINRQSWIGTLGTELSRTKLVMNWQYNLDSALEEASFQTRTISLGFTASRQISPLSSLNASIKYANSDRITSANEKFDSTNWTSSIRLNRKLSQNFSTNLELSYFDRQGSFSALTEREFKERRIAFGITYKYQ